MCVGELRASICASRRVLRGPLREVCKVKQASERIQKDITVWLWPPRNILLPPRCPARARATRTALFTRLEIAANGRGFSCTAYLRARILPIL